MSDSVTEPLPSSLREADRPSDAPVLVSVWHPHCSACRAIEERLSRLERRIGALCTIERLNVMEAPDLAEEIGVRQVPTLLVFRQGTLNARFVGAEKIQAFADRIEEAKIG